MVGVLGVGGTSTVFEAIDETTGTAVAVKAIPRDERLVKRARRELRVAATLDHPGIVRLLDSVADDDYIYVVFELVRGDDLARAFHEGLLDDAGTLRAVAAVCDALAHAHAHGVVHRDVKPGNVLLRDDGILKLTDFGIALVDQPDATLDDRLLGTLSYMAPEQALGRDSGGAADVWSAALIVYEALAGSNPFRARTPRELADRHERVQLSLSTARRDLPPVVQRYIDRALSRDPKRRPSAAELRDVLLHGARAIERGLMSDPTYDPLEPVVRDRRAELRALAARVRVIAPRVVGRSHLRAVPALGAPPAGIVGRTVLLAERVEERVRATGETPRRAARALVASAAAAVVLNSLPFYPVGWPYALALVVGAVAIVRPSLALVLSALLAVPLAGNVAAGLVPVAVGAGVLLVLATFSDRSRAFQPFLAPALGALGLLPLYLVGAAGVRRAHVRFSLGALAPVLTTVAFGLAGAASPLTGTSPFAGLGARLAGEESIGVVASAIVHGSAALMAQSVGWGLLALGARPVALLRGRALRVFGCGYAAAILGVSSLAPVAVGAAPTPVSGLLVGVVATAILLAFRSVMRAPDVVTAPAASAG